MIETWITSCSHRKLSNQFYFNFPFLFEFTRWLFNNVYFVFNNKESLAERICFCVRVIVCIFCEYKRVFIHQLCEWVRNLCMCTHNIQHVTYARTRSRHAHTYKHEHSRKQLHTSNVKQYSPCSLTYTQRFTHCSFSHKQRANNTVVSKTTALTELWTNTNSNKPQTI